MILLYRQSFLLAAGSKISGGHGGELKSSVHGNVFPWENPINSGSLLLKIEATWCHNHSSSPMLSFVSTC